MSSSSPWWLGVLAVLAIGACTYDFEAPFAETPVGGGGSAGQGGSGGTTSGSGGEAGAEQCRNGTDDDGDHLVDCADPDCADHTCMEPPPAGWELGAFVTVPGGDDLPDCVGWPTVSDAHMSLQTDPAECDCSCGSSTVTCSLAISTLFDSTSCSAETLDTWTPSANGACDTVGYVGGSDGSDGIYAEAVVVQNASCAVNEGNHTLPAPRWTDDVRMCTAVLSSGGCGDTEVCAPPAETPFLLCIRQSGDHDCPEPYTGKRIVHGGVDDQRGCDCSCGAPAGAACTAETEVWSYSTSCSGPPDATVSNDGACTEYNDGPVHNGSIRYTATPSGGACPAQGQPTGEITASDPMTICCLP